jgi:hypothetical protein
MDLSDWSLPLTEQLFDSWRPQDKGTRTTWIFLALVVAAGAALRFWGLGNIGLHGDEDVMALATRGILETGAPILPSGMFYPRALPQLYLMALSVATFGDSEWALRLPSAIIGTLMIVAAYWLARRFLTVHWSIAFAAAVALLPSMIGLSQTARMYVFFVTFVILFAVAVFRWERSESTADYAYAVVACIVALLFHTLAVFAALLFFYPWLLKGSKRLFGLGAVAFVACGVIFKLLANWSSAQYFPLVSLEPGAGASVAAGLQNEVSLAAGGLGAAVIAVAAGAAWLVARHRRYPSAQMLWFMAGVLLLAAAAVLSLLIQYHLAGLAWFFGTIFYVRSGRRAIVPAALGLLLLALFGLHAYAAWRSPEVQTFLDLAEALLGKPKPMSYFTFFQFAPAGVIAYALIFLYYAVRFARRRPLPDHSLLFLVAVFAPLFLMAFFAEDYVPERYIIGLLPFFVLAAFAGAHELSAVRVRLYGSPAIRQAVAALVTLAIFIDPAEFRHNVNPGYPDFSYLTDHRGVDHKGAAEFVVSRGSDDDDVVIVVDSQQHGYYLPERMDYYMRSLHDQRNSSFMRDGRMLNLYTGAPQIASGEQLAKVLSDPNYDEVLVVGSGEIERNRMRYMANGIWTTMQDFGFEEAWLGRDQATRVWRYSAGPPSEQASTPAASTADQAQ